MQTLFIVISSLLTLAAGVPYFLDVLHGKTKPRVVTWFVWAVLTAMAAAASLSDHQYASGILTLSETVEISAIVAVGLMKSGILSIARFDVVCLIGALVGMALWWRFNSPAMAVLASIVIDFIGALPTLKHIWEKPSEETWVTFALSSVSGLFAFFAATSIRITELASPVDIWLLNGAFALFILLQRDFVSEHAAN